MIGSAGMGDFGYYIRARREALGLSQEVAGDRAGHRRRWWLELEAGRLQPDRLSLEELRGVAEVLGLDLAEVLGKIDPDMNRRDFLTALTALAAGGVDLERLLADPSYLDGAEAVSQALASRIYVASPAALLAPAEAHLATLRHYMPGPRRLTGVTAYAAALTGHLYSRLQRPGDAYAAYTLALGLAQEAHDPGTQALVQKAKSALHSTVAKGPRPGDTTMALALLDDAVRLASGGPARLRGSILARRAEERAVAGNGDGAHRDLEAAASALSEPDADDGRTYSGARRPAELAAIRGNVELLLGDHSTAVQTLDNTLAGLGPRQKSWRAAVLADQGAAHARSGELEQAVDRLERALQLAREAGASDHVHRVRGIRQRDLGRHERERPVRRLDELLHAG